MTIRDILRRYTAPLLLAGTVAAVPTMVGAQIDRDPEVTPTPTEQHRVHGTTRDTTTFSSQEGTDSLEVGDLRPQSRRERQNPFGQDDAQRAGVPDEDRVGTRDVMSDPRPQSRRERQNPF